MSELKIGQLASPVDADLDADDLRQSMESELTVVAKADEPASEVAERLGAAQGSLVVVVDESGEPAGVVDPDQVRREVARGMTFREIVEVLASEADERAREEKLSRLREIHHSQHWCSAGNHYVNHLPCPDHG